MSRPAPRPEQGNNRHIPNDRDRRRSSPTSFPDRTRIQEALHPKLSRSETPSSHNHVEAIPHALVSFALSTFVLVQG